MCSAKWFKSIQKFYWWKNEYLISSTNKYNCNPINTHTHTHTHTHSFVPDKPKSGLEYKKSGKRENKKNRSDASSYSYSKKCLYLPLTLKASMSLRPNARFNVPVSVTITSSFCCSTQLHLYLPPSYCLAGLMIEASTSKAEDPGFESRLQWDFSGSGHTSDLYLSVAECKLVWADTSLRYTIMLLGPSHHTALPLTTTAQPSSLTALPLTTTAQPSSLTALPLTTTAQPSSLTALPLTTTVQPSSLTALPLTTTAQPSSLTALPLTTTAQPSSLTALPLTTTAQPSSLTALPLTTTVQPSSLTALPLTTTAQPSSLTMTVHPSHLTALPLTTSIQP